MSSVAGLIRDGRRAVGGRDSIPGRRTQEVSHRSSVSQRAGVRTRPILGKSAPLCKQINRLLPMDPVLELAVHRLDKPVGGLTLEKVCPFSWGGCLRRQAPSINRIERGSEHG